jgi:hypothetical protein
VTPRHFVSIGLILASTPLLAACTSKPATPEEKIDLRSLRGQTFDLVVAELPDDATYLTQDASPRFGIDAGYDLGDFGSDRWTVLAVCLDYPYVSRVDKVAVSVIPSNVATLEVREKAKDDDYADSVECSDVFVGAGTPR